MGFVNGKSSAGANSGGEIPEDRAPSGFTGAMTLREVDGIAELAFVREVIRIEAETLQRVSWRLDETVVKVASRIVRGSGSVIVTGMGKAGLVGQKLAATLSSLGTPAFPLHPAEAMHGDLGRVRSGDVVLLLSQSGQTEEMLRLLPALRRQGACLVALTGHANSPLALGAEFVLDLGPIEEACPLGLAPSASTTAMMAVGDALALLVARMRGMQATDFARFHPAGALGRKLMCVDEVMRTGDHIRIAREPETVRAVLIRLGGAKRRTGAIMVVNDAGRLVGIFTDSDLARLFERRREALLDQPIALSMTGHPSCISRGAKVSEAAEALQSRKLSELPVIDDDGKPIGLVDITDLLGMVPPVILERDVTEDETEVAGG